MATDMLTNIENNVKMNFFKYVNRFVNSSYKKINNDLIEKAQIGKKTELRKQLSKEIESRLEYFTEGEKEIYFEGRYTERENYIY
jgi:hypothetical protein